MTTAVRTSPSRLLELDPSGIPLDSSMSIPGHASKLTVPGLDRAAIVARVQDVEPARSGIRLAWGIADGRAVLFEVDDDTARDFRASLEAGDEPTAIVEPGQILGMDLDRAGR